MSTKNRYNKAHVYRSMKQAALLESITLLENTRQMNTNCHIRSQRTLKNLREQLSEL